MNSKIYKGVFLVENKIIPETDNMEEKESEVVVEEVSENLTAEPKQERRCPNCQALLTEEQLFCPECGTPYKKICSNCQAELREGQAFCPSCGKKTEEAQASFNENIALFNAQLEQKKGKKKTVAIVIGIIVAILIAVGGVMGYQYNENQKVLKYISKVEAYVETMQEAEDNLTYLNEVWEIVEDSSWMIRSSMESYARSLNADCFSEEETRKEELASAYNELLSFDSKNKDVAKINVKVKAVYNSYTSQYSMLVDTGSTTFGLTTFSNKISDLKNSVKKVKADYTK